MNFERGDARPAGHMFIIPAPLVHLGDRKPKRPFLLLARCTEGATGNLALMTTKATERLYGATLLEFADQRGKLGLPDQESSYVNLSALTFHPASALNQSLRSYARRMTAVRAALKRRLASGRDWEQVRQGKACGVSSCGYRTKWPVRSVSASRLW